MISCTPNNHKKETLHFECVSHSSNAQAQLQGEPTRTLRVNGFGPPYITQDILAICTNSAVFKFIRMATLLYIYSYD